MGRREIKNTGRTEHETLEVTLPQVSALEKQYLEVTLSLLVVSIICC